MNVLLDLVKEHPAGISFERLLGLARDRIRPTLSEGQVKRELHSLGQEVEYRDGLWIASPAKNSPEVGSASVAPKGSRAKRIVVVDCESIVRQVPEPPYKQRYLFQIAARRIGMDTTWVEAQPSIEIWIRLSEDLESSLPERSKRAFNAHQRITLADAMSRYVSFVHDADYITAYNGTGLDF